MSDDAAPALVQVSAPPLQSLASCCDAPPPAETTGPTSSVQPSMSQPSTSTPAIDRPTPAKPSNPDGEPQASNAKLRAKQPEEQDDQKPRPNAPDDPAKPEATHSTTTTKATGPPSSEAAEVAITAVAEAISEADAVPEPKISKMDSKEIELISADVAELLGHESAATFRRAMALTLASGLTEVGGGVAAAANEDKAGVMLQEATRLFVLLLTSVPEDAQESAGFAELLTGYGKSLLGFVRKAGQRQGVLGAKVKGESAQPEEEDLEEEDDNEELAWTQLEAARVAFERLVKQGDDRFNGRLGDVHSCLGDLLLEGDAWEAASREYDLASKLLCGRRKAEVLYKQYLAMRRDAAVKAVEALKESVRVFEDVESDEETIKELKEELSGFEEAIRPAVSLLKQDEKRSGDMKEATVVQPRKRAKKDK